MSIASNEKIVSTVNELIVTCRDAEEGFRTAAQAVQSSALKSLFSACARQRTLLLSELQSEVRRLGGDPDESGTIVGALHRGWLTLKQALTGQDEQAVVQEAERGDEVALQSYEMALKENLPHTVRAILERQYFQLKQARERISAIRKEPSALLH